MDHLAGSQQWVCCPMERVLDMYELPFDPQYPVVCLDESPKQLTAETQ